jgi:hypothetical protein
MGAIDELLIRFFNTIGRMMRETGLRKINIKLFFFFNQTKIQIIIKKKDMDRYGAKIEKDIAYHEPLSRHRNVFPLYHKIPSFYNNAFVSPTCSLIGEVYLG